MVIQKSGARFFAEGKEFVIGGKVFANTQSDYMGLFGTVTEIRTDEDRESGNDTPDIICEFCVPESKSMIRELERRFSWLYRCSKKINELSFDYVIMAPEMLEPIPAEQEESLGELLTLMRVDDLFDHVEATALAIANDMGVLLRTMQEDLEKCDFSPGLSRVETQQNGYQFVYGDNEGTVEGPCMIYCMTKTPVLPATTTRRTQNESER